MFFHLYESGASIGALDSGRFSGIAPYRRSADGRLSPKGLQRGSQPMRRMTRYSPRVSLRALFHAM
jgi:hypothetical protein